MLVEVLLLGSASVRARIAIHVIAHVLLSSQLTS